MPISAQQWRVKTGAMNASKGFKPNSIKLPPFSSLFDLPPPPPPDWQGYNTALVLVCLPLLCRIYAVGMAVMAHIARRGLGYVSTAGSSLDIRTSYASYHQQSAVFLGLVFYLSMVIGVVFVSVWEYRERGKHHLKLIQPLPDVNFAWLEVDSEREGSVHVRPRMISGCIYTMIEMDTQSSLKCVRNTGNSRKRVHLVSEFTCVGVVSIALRWATAVLAILLLMAGDVERNPGPPPNNLRKFKEHLTEFSAAAARGDVRLVSSILERPGIDVNFTKPETQSVLKLLSGINPPPPPLFAACRAGHVEVVRVLLKHKDIQVNIASGNYTPLSVAAEHGYTEIMQLLLEHGAGVDRGHNLGGISSPLGFAADNNQYEAAVLLLKHGAKVNPDYTPPLLLAVSKGHTKMARLLLDNGAEVQVDDERGDGTPLFYAVERGHTECAKLLLEKGADVNKPHHNSGETPLMLASRNGHINDVQLLLAHNAKVNTVSSRKDTALSLACDGNHVEVAEMLIKNGADVNHEMRDLGKSILLRAIESGTPDIVSLLLRNGAKVDVPNRDGKTPLMCAVERIDIRIVEELLTYSAVVDRKSLSEALNAKSYEIVRTLLRYGGDDLKRDAGIVQEIWSGFCTAAINNGDYKLGEILLPHVPNIKLNDVSNSRDTPLMMVARIGHRAFVKLLLDHGAQPNIQNANGDTALILASQGGHAECVELLLQQEDIDVNLQNSNEHTALMVASERGHASVVQLLLEHGAELEISDTRGCSALFYGVKSNSVTVVETLLAKGANASRKTVDEKTVIQYAYECGKPNNKIIKTLQEAKTKVLTETEHLKICQYIQPLEERQIILLGQALGLLRSNLKKMKSLPDDMVDAWLIRADHVFETSGHPTWESLCKALRDIGEHGIAARIKVMSRTDEPTDGRNESSAEKRKTDLEGRKEEREDDHVEDREKEADAEDLVDPSEAEHLAAVDRAMKEKGTLDHTLAHGVLVGPARSGKSSLMTRLVGEMPSPTSPSTGVAEQAIQVGVRKSSSIALGVHDCNWFKLAYDEEAIRWISLAPENSSQQPVASPPTTQLQSDQENELPAVTPPTPLLHGKPENVTLLTSAKSETVSLPAGYVAPMGVFKAAIRGRGLEGLRQRLENSWSFYLTDAGGQPEFQELLPLLVSGPSVFFITFRLNQGLYQQFTIEYHLPDGERSEPYQSTLTVVETILQTLASIASMGTFVYKGSQMESIPLKPKVLIVGTHKDMLNPATADSDIKKIDQYLQGIIKSTSHYQDLVTFATKHQMIYTVNNLSEDDSDFNKIRSGVERVVCRPKLKMSFPSHWLIFSLVVRQEMIKESIISFEQCSAIAQDCGITDPEELGHALWFLHTKIGLIRHFPTPGLHDLVIRHPQILFDMVTKLIVNTFTFENADECLSTEFEKRGIFTLEDFKQIDRASAPLLPPEKLLQLLEHLRIVAPFEGKGQRKYFLPCVLAHSEESESPHSPQSSDIPPLLVTFECGYCPKGLYGALLVCLLTNELGSEFKWELMTEQIFRDQVTFDVSPYDTITLKIHPKYLEIRIGSYSTKSKRTKTVADVCNKVCCLLEEGIRKVSHEMKLTSCAKHSLSFYCRHPDCTPKEAHPATKILKDDDGSLCTLLCSKSGRSDLPARYYVWFGEERKEIDHSVATSQRDLTVTRPKRALAATPHPDHTTTTAGDKDSDLLPSCPKKPKLLVVYQDTPIIPPLLPSARIAPDTGRIYTDFRPATLDTSEDTSATNSWGLNYIHSFGLNGTGVTIAVVDSGVNHTHVAFESSTVKGNDFIFGYDPSSTLWQTNPTSHGTMVAFVAAGKGFKGIHIDSQAGHQVELSVNSGVAPNSSLVICNVGESYNWDPVSHALDKLIEEREKQKPSSATGTGENFYVDVVCMSFGAKNDPRNKDQRRIEKRISKLRELGVIMVAAAGNLGKYCNGVWFPACLPDVISVGALTPTGEKSQTNPPKDIDVYAPGEDIAYPAFDSKEGVMFSSGSSCAAPAVAGLVALLVQLSREYPNLNLKIDLHYVRTVLRQMEKKGDPVLLDPREYFQSILQSLQHEQQIAEHLKREQKMKLELEHLRANQQS